MSSLSISVSQFEVIEANLNIELITPVLENVGVLLPSDKEKLAGKLPKPGVKFILKKVKQHLEGSKLFCHCLKQTIPNEGHQKILQVLYPTENLDLEGITLSLQLKP